MNAAAIIGPVKSPITVGVCLAAQRALEKHQIEELRHTGERGSCMQLVSWLLNRMPQLRARVYPTRWRTEIGYDTTADIKARAAAVNGTALVLVLPNTSASIIAEVGTEGTMVHL